MPVTSYQHPILSLVPLLMADNSINTPSECMPRLEGIYKFPKVGTALPNPLRLVNAPLPCPGLLSLVPAVPHLAS